MEEKLPARFCRTGAGMVAAYRSELQHGWRAVDQRDQRLRRRGRWRQPGSRRPERSEPTRATADALARQVKAPCPIPPNTCPKNRGLWRSSKKIQGETDERR